MASIVFTAGVKLNVDAFLEEGGDGVEAFENIRQEFYILGKTAEDKKGCLRSVGIAILVGEAHLAALERFPVEEMPR